MGRQEDVIFNTAKNAVKRLTQKYENQDDWEIEQNIWKKLVPNSKRSPQIMGIGSEPEDKFIVYYPKYSAEYCILSDHFSCEIEVVGGTVVDKFTGRKYEKGDKVKLKENSKFMPVTLSRDAYIIIDKKK